MVRSELPLRAGWQFFRDRRPDTCGGLTAP